MKILRVLAGIGLFVAGLFGLGQLGIISFFSTFVSGLLGYWLIFGTAEFEGLFKKPQRGWLKWSLLMLLINALWSLGAGAILQLLGLTLHANPVVDTFGVMLPFIPFMLMGEELLSLALLNGARKFIPTLAASIFSAVIFGLIHFNTYWNGDLSTTLLHILLIQGVARIFLNIAYLKADSIWGSWSTHLAFDLFTLGFAALLSTQ
ncbi:CPBP family glutamic-type intramembrane protease [Lapidilactobacillus luobeiensis]|uniref:CPBP family glutamic-type intramembrane protease n=1 Tax=Lapidilactobacillus luobeiensis TaxID=2950371 RepID=UPI0021C3E360|nr:CPBP family glutamic-type intramembrane protease [Lapidilactobacillus luobeiensis]